MPDKLADNIIVTSIGAFLTFVTSVFLLRIKSGNDFRKGVYKTTSTLNDKINNNHNHVLENYIDKDDFNILRDDLKIQREDMNKRFDKLDNYIMGKHKKET